MRFRVALAERPASVAGWLHRQLAQAIGHASGVTWLAREDLANGRVALACFADGQLVGFAALQIDGVPERIDWLRRLVAQGALGDDQRLWLLADLLPPGERECGRQLCACLQVRELALRDALQAGCHTVDALVAKTGAGGKCGTCLPELGAWLEAATQAPARQVSGATSTLCSPLDTNATPS